MKQDAPEVFVQQMGQEEDFLELSSEVLESMPRVRFPVGLFFLNESIMQMTRVLERDERVTPEKMARLQELTSKESLYFPVSDFPAYARHLIKNPHLIPNNSAVDAPSAAWMFVECLNLRMDTFLSQPVADTLAHVRQAMDVLLSWLEQDPDRVSLLHVALNKEHTLASHSVGVCCVGMGVLYLLCRGKVTWKMYHLAGLGFLLHDLGMMQIPEFVNQKPRTLNHRERQRVQEHPPQGLRTAMRLGLEMPQVLSCIEDHHERLDGSGYPRKLRAGKISMLAKVCGVVDSFCAMTSKRVYATPKTMSEAATILTSDAQCFDDNVLEALRQYVVKTRDLPVSSLISETA